ncbi:MAG: UDP-3-O-acyl-N-acetylglucosamine deacetylase [Paracoccaceae bacterium]|nr:UDP-3-O-acyl-N-acetylglucosamine deacetylase [Paracoccaceae bacterium]
MQRTLKASVTFTGVGLHSGNPVRMTVHPASAEYGIWFRRTDIDLGDTMIAARWDGVEQSRLCTLLRNEAGVGVSTVEHVMAALAGCGVQNALIEIDGPEVPILDGSAAPFVEAFLMRGLRDLDAPVRMIRILKPVEIRNGDAFARLEPSDRFEIDFQIEFADAAIGVQAKRLNMANGTFVRELSNSRTFCRNADVQAMRSAGLAKGGSLSNAVVVDGAQVLTPGGLRHTDEAVRHKMLDALGDLALAGAPIMGRYVGYRSGHAMTNQLLRALFEQPEAWEMALCDEDTAARLPGVGVKRADIPAVA